MHRQKMIGNLQGPALTGQSAQESTKEPNQSHENSMSVSVNDPALKNQSTPSAQAQGQLGSEKANNNQGGNPAINIPAKSANLQQKSSDRNQEKVSSSQQNPSKVQNLSKNVTQNEQIDPNKPQSVDQFTFKRNEKKAYFGQVHGSWNDSYYNLNHNGTGSQRPNYDRSFMYQGAGTDSVTETSRNSRRGGGGLGDRDHETDFYQQQEYGGNGGQMQSHEASQRHRNSERGGVASDNRTTNNGNNYNEVGLSSSAHQQHWPDTSSNNLNSYEDHRSYGNEMGQNDWNNGYGGGGRRGVRDHDRRGQNGEDRHMGGRQDGRDQRIYDDYGDGRDGRMNNGGSSNNMWAQSSHHRDSNMMKIYKGDDRNDYGGEGRRRDGGGEYRQRDGRDHGGGGGGRRDDGFGAGSGYYRQNDSREYGSRGGQGRRDERRGGRYHERAYDDYMGAGNGIPDQDHFGGGGGRDRDRGFGGGDMSHGSGRRNRDRDRGGRMGDGRDKGGNGGGRDGGKQWQPVSFASGSAQNSYQQIDDLMNGAHIDKHNEEGVITEQDVGQAPRKMSDRLGAANPGDTISDSTRLHSRFYTQWMDPIPTEGMSSSQSMQNLKNPEQSKAISNFFNNNACPGASQSFGQQYAISEDSLSRDDPRDRFGSDDHNRYPPKKGRRDYDDPNDLWKDHGPALTLNSSQTSQNTPLEKSENGVSGSANGNQPGKQRNGGGLNTLADPKTETPVLTNTSSELERDSAVVTSSLSTGNRDAEKTTSSVSNSTTNRDYEKGTSGADRSGRNNNYRESDVGTWNNQNQNSSSQAIYAPKGSQNSGSGQIRENTRYQESKDSQRQEYTTNNTQYEKRGGGSSQQTSSSNLQNTKNNDQSQASGKSQQESGKQRRRETNSAQNNQVDKKAQEQSSSQQPQKQESAKNADGRNNESTSGNQFAQSRQQEGGNGGRNKTANTPQQQENSHSSSQNQEKREKQTGKNGQWTNSNTGSKQQQQDQSINSEQNSEDKSAKSTSGATNPGKTAETASSSSNTREQTNKSHPSTSNANQNQATSTPAKVSQNDSSNNSGPAPAPSSDQPQQIQQAYYKESQTPANTSGSSQTTQPAQNASQARNRNETQEVLHFKLDSSDSVSQNTGNSTGESVVSEQGKLLLELSLRVGEKSIVKVQVFENDNLKTLAQRLMQFLQQKGTFLLADEYSSLFQQSLQYFIETKMTEIGQSTSQQTAAPCSTSSSSSFVGTGGLPKSTPSREFRPSRKTSFVDQQNDSQLAVNSTTQPLFNTNAPPTTPFGMGQNSFVPASHPFTTPVEQSQPFGLGGTTLRNSYMNQNENEIDLSLTDHHHDRNDHQNLSNAQLNLAQNNLHPTPHFPSNKSASRLFEQQTQQNMSQQIGSNSHGMGNNSGFGNLSGFHALVDNFAHSRFKPQMNNQHGASHIIQYKATNLNVFQGKTDPTFLITNGGQPLTGTPFVPSSQGNNHLSQFNNTMLHHANLNSFTPLGNQGGHNSGNGDQRNNHSQSSNNANDGGGRRDQNSHQQSNNNNNSSRRNNDNSNHSQSNNRSEQMHDRGDRRSDGRDGGDRKHGNSQNNNSGGNHNHNGQSQRDNGGGRNNDSHNSSGNNHNSMQQNRNNNNNQHDERQQRDNNNSERERGGNGGHNQSSGKNGNHSQGSQQTSQRRGKGNGGGGGGQGSQNGQSQSSRDGNNGGRDRDRGEQSGYMQGKKGGDRDRGVNHER